MNKTFAGVVALTSFACSLWLDWDPNGLPCETVKVDGSEQKLCAQGYLCFANACIEEHSLPKGENCASDQVCAQGLICGPHFSCTERCSKYYAAQDDDACGPGRYCKAYVVGEDAARRITGGCVDNDACGADATLCEALDGVLPRGRKDTCVEMKKSVFSCQFGCEITFNPDFKDSCGTPATSARQDRTYCQILGTKEGRLPVCVQSPATPQSLDAPCAPIDNPCDAGLVCLGTSGQGVCKQYCSVDSHCGGLQCCTLGQNSLDKVYGYCDASCDL